MVLETIAVIFFIIAIFFIVLEITKMNKEKKPKHSFGNGQYIGLMENQNDYFSITEISENESLLILIDGISQRVNIRQSVMLANSIIIDIYKKNNELHKLKDILEYSFLEIEIKNKKYVFENRIGLSIIGVQIKNNILSYGNIGTCSLLLYRKGKIININIEDEVLEKYDEITLESKDKIILLSKGAFLSLTEIEIINELEANKQTNDKAIYLINTIKKKNFVHQENATILIVEIDDVS